MLNFDSWNSIIFNENAQNVYLWSLDFYFPVSRLFISNSAFICLTLGQSTMSISGSLSLIRVRASWFVFLIHISILKNDLTPFFTFSTSLAPHISLSSSIVSPINANTKFSQNISISPKICFLLTRSHPWMFSRSSHSGLIPFLNKLNPSKGLPDISRRPSANISLKNEAFP